MTISHSNEFNALASIVELCDRLNESKRLRAAVSPRSDPISRIRDLWISGANVRLLMYWGGYARECVGTAENRLVDYIENLRRIIADTGQCNCEVQVIFTDTHAMLNGMPKQSMQSYFDAARSIINLPFWSTDLLSNIVGKRQLKLDSSYNSFFKREISMLRKQSEHLHDVSQGASKADDYLAANLLEAGAVLERFPTAIFLHAGVSELNFFLPSLPKLYIFTGTGGSTKKPWFLPTNTED